MLALVKKRKSVTYDEMVEFCEQENHRPETMNRKMRLNIKTGEVEPIWKGKVIVGWHIGKRTTGIVLGDGTIIEHVTFPPHQKPGDAEKIKEAYKIFANPYKHVEKDKQKMEYELYAKVLKQVKDDDDFFRTMLNKSNSGKKKNK